MKFRCQLLCTTRIQSSCGGPVMVYFKQPIATLGWLCYNELKMGILQKLNF